MTFTAFVSFLMGPMFALSGIGAQLTEAMAGLDRTMELLRKSGKTRTRAASKAMGPIEGLVSFEHVNFSYKEGNPVLHDVTFESRPGR
jgi:ABC-type multidrug transport system, ATPase and permease components